MIISILLLLLYGEMETILGWTSLKKKQRKFYLKLYWYGAIIFLIGTLAD
jgi:hypothetical protein